jgi:hypothetical protein
VATKSAQQEPEKAEVVEELLDALDTSLDRVKVLYEQYFLGIQKQPPTFMHTDIERKIRDLAQLQIRNTALRYRYATLGQKFGSYNSYWRRTLRQIEQGTYTRNLSKIGRQAARTGDDVPEEILAAMPKRMREQVRRDREAALANARRREKPVSDGSELLTLVDEDVEIDVDEFEPAAFIGESTAVRRNVLTAGGAHRVADDDDEFDVDAFFAKVTSEGDPNPVPVGVPAPRPAAAPATRKRTGSSGHPRPVAPSRSAVAIPRGDRLPTAGGPLQVEGAKPSVAPPAPPRVTARQPGVAPASAPPAPPRVTARQPSVEPASAKPPLPSIVAAAAKRPSGAQASSPPVAPSSTAQTAAAPAAAQPDADEDAVQTSVIPVRPMPPPLPPPRATQALPRMPVQAAQPIKPPVQATQPIKPPVQATQPIRPPVQPIKPPAQAPPVQAPPVQAPVLAAQPIQAPVQASALAPSQATRSLPVLPGAAAARGSAQVETMAGPFPRIPSLPSVPLPPPTSSGSPPPDLERAAAIAAARAPSGVPAARPSVPRIPTLAKSTPAQATSTLAPARVAAPEPPPARVTSPPPARVTPPPATRAVAPARPAAAPPERPTPPPPPERVAPPERPTPPRSPTDRPVPEPRQAPPPGMSDADVNALYAKYVKAKEILGEQAGPGSYGKLLKTINAQAPKIMEQYKSKGVDFSVIVKDNQVVIRAKPKS